MGIETTLLHALLLQGKNAVSVGRILLGATNPLESAPGTIRGVRCCLLHVFTVVTSRFSVGLLHRGR
jgi:nucleoside diphosphate kinase